MSDNDLFPDSFVEVGEEISVNGVIRKNLNSSGMPITNVRQSLENFWEWFGDSEVVDSGGNPLVVYHGTKADISKFEIGRPSINTWAFGEWEVRRHGVFASPEKGFSTRYATTGDNTTGANVMSVYLKIENMFDFTKGAHGLSDALWNTLEHAGLNMKWLTNLDNTWEAFDNEDGAQFVEILKNIGYDGVRMYESGEPDWDPAEVFVAFSPNQLKSVTGNIGRYHPEKGEISELRKLSGINESIGDPTSDLYTGVTKAIPGMYALTDLKNQDPYLQYRFGVAMAGALAKKEGLAGFEKESKYGENMIVIAPTEVEREIMNLALKGMKGYSGIEQLSTIPSEERTDTDVESIIGTKALTESDDNFYDELNELKKMAGIGNIASAPPAMDFADMNRQAMKKVEHMKENNIKPGDPEWFRLWFAKTAITGEKPF